MSFCVQGESVLGPWDANQPSHEDGVVAVSVQPQAQYPKKAWFKEDTLPFACQSVACLHGE